MCAIGPDRRLSGKSACCTSLKDLNLDAQHLHKSQVWLCDNIPWECENPHSGTLLALWPFFAFHFTHRAFLSVRSSTGRFHAPGLLVLCACTRLHTLTHHTVSGVDLDRAIVLIRLACFYGSDWALFILVGLPGKVPGAEKPSAVWNEGIGQVLEPHL